MPNASASAINRSPATDLHASRLDWNADAALVQPDHHVFCAGSLAQCLRRWLRLSDQERATAVLRLTNPIDGQRTLTGEVIASLAALKEVRTY
jgi:hypothetical protein